MGGCRRRGGNRFCTKSSVSPELQQLLETLDAKLTCADREKPRAAATFERLLTEAMQRRPGTSRDECKRQGKHA